MVEKPKHPNHIDVPVRFSNNSITGSAYLKYPITQLHSQIHYGPPELKLSYPGPGTEVYISGIPPDYDLNELFLLFMQAGIIHTARFVISFR